ncbi:hypothetical protein PIB30_085542 [Stylosanthes scabra]|uniref:Aminotransferase-like plant mobile domain-containing protein n=1 Tax=Stylosanthes scabra TaxID=79078 RepID=A0ABU6QT40_9FABA|nr:hypothetical protein [Stylosanthes scabra]
MGLVDIVGEVESCVGSIERYALPPIGPRSMHGCHTLLMSWIYYRLPSRATNLARPHTFPLATRWRGRRGNNDYGEAQLLRYRERLDLLGIDDFMWMPYNAAPIMSVVPQEFMGAPHGDFFTSAVPLIFFRFIESARNDDRWWPERLAEWFDAWNNRRSAGRRLVIDPAAILHPSRQYFDWYKERTRRFLSNPSRFYDPRAVGLPPQAPVGYGDSPAVAWSDVPQDRMQGAMRARRGRQAKQEDPGRDDLPHQPPQDDLPPRRSPQYPDPQYYCPQPFEPAPAQPMFDFLHGASSYEIGGSS